MSPVSQRLKREGRWQRRLSLTVAMVGLVAVASAVFVSRQWIVNQYYLWRAGRASASNRGEYVGLLIERGCVEVLPYLLRLYEENPEQGTIGLLTWEHSDRLSVVLSFGPASIPYLARCIGNDACDQRLVFEALCAFGKEGHAALHALIKYIETRRQSEHLVSAMNTIGCMEAAARDAVPALLTFERDNREEVRWQLYVTLAGIGPAAEAAVPMLLRAVRLEDGERRCYAAYALACVAPGRPDGISCLSDCLRDDTWYVRQYSAEFLGELGPAALRAAGKLLEAVRDANDSVAKAALYAFMRVAIAFPWPFTQCME